jgi:hypothetical protein
MALLDLVLKIFGGLEGDVPVAEGSFDDVFRQALQDARTDLAEIGSSVQELAAGATEQERQFVHQALFSSRMLQLVETLRTAQARNIPTVDTAQMADLMRGPETAMPVAAAEMPKTIDRGEGIATDARPIERPLDQERNDLLRSILEVLRGGVIASSIPPQVVDEPLPVAAPELTGEPLPIATPAPTSPELVYEPLPELAEAPLPVAATVPTAPKKARKPSPRPPAGRKATPARKAKGRAAGGIGSQLGGIAKSAFDEAIVSPLMTLKDTLAKTPLLGDMAGLFTGKKTEKPETVSDKNAVAEKTLSEATLQTDMGREANDLLRSILEVLQEGLGITSKQAERDEERLASERQRLLKEQIDVASLAERATQTGGDGEEEPKGGMLGKILAFLGMHKLAAIFTGLGTAFAAVTAIATTVAIPALAAIGVGLALAAPLRAMTKSLERQAEAAHKRSVKTQKATAVKRSIRERREAMTAEGQISEDEQMEISAMFKAGEIKSPQDIVYALNRMRADRPMQTDSLSEKVVASETMARTVSMEKSGGKAELGALADSIAAVAQTNDTLAQAVSQIGSGGSTVVNADGINAISPRLLGLGGF